MTHCPERFELLVLNLVYEILNYASTGTIGVSQSLGCGCWNPAVHDSMICFDQDPAACSMFCRPMNIIWGQESLDLEIPGAQRLCNMVVLRVAHVPYSCESCSIALEYSCFCRTFKKGMTARPGNLTRKNTVK
jgi:hypothetical protein